MEHYRNELMSENIAATPNLWSFFVLKLFLVEQLQLYVLINLFWMLCSLLKNNVIM